MRLFILFISVAFLLGCSDNPEENQENTTPVEEQNQGDYWTKNHCLRSIPEATLDAKKVKSHYFELEENHGIERARLANGDSLTLKNGGCQLYEISYTYYLFNYLYVLLLCFVV